MSDAILVCQTTLHEPFWAASLVVVPLAQLGTGSGRVFLVTLLPLGPLLTSRLYHAFSTSQLKLRTPAQRSACSRKAEPAEQQVNSELVPAA